MEIDGVGDVGLAAGQARCPGDRPHGLRDVTGAGAAAEHHLADPHREVQRPVGHPLVQLGEPHPLGARVDQVRRPQPRPRAPAAPPAERHAATVATRSRGAEFTPASAPQAPRTRPSFPTVTDGATRGQGGVMASFRATSPGQRTHQHREVGDRPASSISNRTMPCTCLSPTWPRRPAREVSPRRGRPRSAGPRSCAAPRRAPPAPWLRPERSVQRRAVQRRSGAIRDITASRSWRRRRSGTRG